MPIVMDSMDTSVVSAMMLAANLPSPPAATAMAKLAAAVGLEKNIQRMMRSRPSIPMAHAAAQANTGNIAILMALDCMADKPEAFTPAKDSVPPTQIRARGKVSPAKYSPDFSNHCGM